MFQQLISLFLSFLAFLASLFGQGGAVTPAPTPTPDPGQEIVYLSDRTISYGESDDQTLDLFLPAGKTGNAGLVLFIHGGAWVTGTKETYLPEALRYQAMGYVTASINYRYLGNGVLPADELDDITSALRAIQTACAQKGVNVSRTVIVGSSSGAHLGLLYAYTRQSQAPVTPVAVVSSSAPTDFTDPAFLQSGAGELLAGSVGVNTDTLVMLMQSGIGQMLVPTLKTLSPAKQVTRSSVPTLMAHGKNDTIVPYSNAERLDAALTENGVRHDFVTFPNSGHALLNDPDCTLRFQTLTAQYIATYLG